MKIICLLQNAWGGKPLPSIFKPNERNHSARVLRKIIGEEHVIHFCNTTDIVTPTASGRAVIDEAHMKKLIPRLKEYHLIIICGKQAALAFAKYEYGIDRPIIYIPHPASRNFSTIQRDEISAIVASILHH